MPSAGMKIWKREYPRVKVSDTFKKRPRAFSCKVRRERIACRSGSAAVSVSGFTHHNKEAFQTPPLLAFFLFLYLQIDVVLLVVLEHDLGLDLALHQVARVHGRQVVVVVDEVLQVTPELVGRGHRHQDLVLSSVRADLGHFDKAAARILLDVQVEALALQHDGARSQVSRRQVTASRRLVVAAAVAGRVRAGHVVSVA